MTRFAPRLHAAAALVLLLALLAPQTADASKRKANKFFEQGRQAETVKSYDQALEFYEQAALEEPDVSRYEIAVLRMRFVAGQAHVGVGRKLIKEGSLEEALAEFERALEIDPASAVAAQFIQRVKKLIATRDGGEPTAKSREEITAGALERDRASRGRMVASLREPPKLQPLSTELIDVTMSEQAKVVVETIGKLAGINVLFDPDFQDKKIDISIQNATLEEALDYVGLIAKTYWKPISHNAIFVTNDNTNKRRDYEEEIVKTIYLTNVSTPQELQEITTAIRGLTDIRRMFPVSSMNAIILRGTASKLALAEKVIHDVDKAKPEVIIDVIVLETSKERTRELGISPVSGGQNGISIPIVFSPRSGIMGGGDGTDGGVGAGGVRLGNLQNLGGNDFVTTLPGAQITALLSSADANVLQSPRIRVTDNHQASLRIGDRIPIATGSFQPGIGGVGINPLVNTQFNFTDVGVNIDLQPHIHNDHEISLHIEIEISNVTSFVDIGGISQPIIGQRTITHDIRIKEGEASIIGGLNQKQVFKTKSGIPFLGEIPWLGRLFSVEKTERRENEILIVLIPHIVRLPEIEDSNLKGVASGTDQVFRVRYYPTDNDKPALPPVERKLEQPAITPPPAPASEQPDVAPAETAPAPVEAAPAETPPAPAVEPAEPVQPQAVEQPAAAGVRFAVQPSSPSLGVGQQLRLDILVQNAEQLFGVPMRLRYDREKLRVVEIIKGDFLAGDEATDLIFSRNIRNQVGQSAVNISRFPGTGGADGSGVLITVVFEGVAPGAADVRVVATGARNASSEVVEIAAAKLSVNVGE